MGRGDFVGGLVGMGGWEEGGIDDIVLSGEWGRRGVGGGVVLVWGGEV